MKRKRPPKSRSAAMVVVLLCAAFTALHGAGCGGGTQEPKSPGFDASVPPPSTPEEALEQFDRAALQVDESLVAMNAYAPPPTGVAQQPGQYSVDARPEATTAMPAPPPPPAAPPAPAPAETAASKKEAKADSESREVQGGAPMASGDPCETACRALASMGRAAEHLCGLAGSEDPRCNNARERLRAAEGRVRQSCPRCAG